MTVSDAVRELKQMYEQGMPTGEATTMVRLFGIKHAAALEGMPLKEIAERATGKVSYSNEIWKGMKLAAYVTVK